MRQFTDMAKGLIIVAACVGSVAHAKGKPTLLAIDCPVTGAIVEIDGQGAGKTPLAPIVITPGAHTVRVRKLGYLEFSDKVNAQPGTTVHLIADLLPTAGVIKVSANVAGAQVQVDGVAVGPCPGEYEVKIGRRVVVVSAAKYRQYSVTLQVNAGNSYEVKARLDKDAAAAANLDLDLEPLAAAAPSKAPPGKAKTSPKAGTGGDDLDLEPLVVPDLAPIARRPAAGVTPRAEPGSTSPSSSERISPSPARRVDTVPIVAIPPPSPLGDNAFIGESVAPPTPWYKQYWVWGAAAAVVVAGTTAAILLSQRGSDTTIQPNGLWQVQVGYTNY